MQYNDEREMTQAEKTFLMALGDGLGPFEASAKAFPMMDDPLSYGLSLIDTDQFIKHRLSFMFDKHGMRDETVARRLIEALDKAEDAPEVTRAEVSVLKEIAKLKDLYPKDKMSKQQQQQEVNEMTQDALARLYWNNATKHMEEPDLIKKLKQDTIDLPPLSDSEVFDD